jgi:hypothetical protein
MRILALAFLPMALLGVPQGAAAVTKFDLAGVEVTLPEDGWEITDVKARGSQIGAGGVDGVVTAEGKVLMLRSSSGQVLAAMLIRGSRGSARALRFNDSRCPPWPQNAESMYARRLTSSDSAPPQCLLVEGPVNGPEAMSRWFGSNGPSAKDLPAPASAWHVIAFAYNTMFAQFTIDALVLADGFAGLADARPVAAPQGPMPAAVAAWGDAVGAAMQKALGGVFSRSTQLPPLTFAASPR